MASSTRVQLTYEELTDIIACLEQDASFNRRLFKKLVKAVHGLEPSAESSVERFIGSNSNHAAPYSTGISNGMNLAAPAFKPTDSIIERVMNKLATDEIVTDEEREQFHKVAGYYPI